MTDLPNDDVRVDRALRPAFARLRSDAERLDVAAARRQLESRQQPVRSPRPGSRQVLVVALAGLAAIGIGGGLGVLVATLRDDPDQVSTAGQGEEGGTTAPGDDHAGSTATTTDAESTDDPVSDTSDPSGQDVDATDPSGDGGTGDSDSPSPGGETVAGGPGAAGGDGEGEGGAVTPDGPVRLWSVVLVADDDTLNVRSGPGVANDVVGELAPDTSGIEVGADQETVGGATWRRVRLGSLEGWVNSRFLAAAPNGYGADERAELESTAADIIAFLSGDEESGPGRWLAPDGLYLGGVGVYGDYPFLPRQVAASSLGTRQGWETPIDLTPADWDDELGTCTPCTTSPMEFIGLPADRAPGYEVDQSLTAGPDAGFLNGPAAHLNRLNGMHHVTVNIPASGADTVDWIRIHLFFDWADGDHPRLRAVYRWGWTP